MEKFIYFRGTKIWLVITLFNILHKISKLTILKSDQTIILDKPPCFVYQNAKYHLTFLLAIVYRFHSECFVWNKLISWLTATAKIAKGLLWCCRLNCF